MEPNDCKGAGAPAPVPPLRALAHRMDRVLPASPHLRATAKSCEGTQRHTQRDAQRDAESGAPAPVPHHCEHSLTGWTGC
jgi:hypothetical protein